MIDEEQHLLRALAGMCAQYLSEGDGLDHMCMNAGERAVELLFKYGLVDSMERGAGWTEAGRALLRSN
jgi:hypothetical protein